MNPNGGTAALWEVLFTGLAGLGALLNLVLALYRLGDVLAARSEGTYPKRWVGYSGLAVHTSSLMTFVYFLVVGVRLLELPNTNGVSLLTLGSIVIEIALVVTAFLELYLRNRLYRVLERPRMRRRMERTARRK